MKINYVAIALLVVSFAAAAFGQRQQGPPGAGAPPRPPMGENGPNGQAGPPAGDWIRPFDTNQNGNLETEEFRAAAEMTFRALDKNGNGTLEPPEYRRPPRNGGNKPRPGVEGQISDQEPPEQPRAEMERQPGRMENTGQPGQMRGPDQQGPPRKPLLPPFFFQDRAQGDNSVTRAEFDQIVNAVFTQMDKNGDGTLTREEARHLPPPPPGRGPGPEGPPPPPNAQFIGAEMRFGEKLVTGQPFSAETVIEDTRRLYDGTTVKREQKGAIYRDTAGRTRREQPLNMVGGFNVAGSDQKGVVLVFINDFVSKTQISLDQNNKIARKSMIRNDRGPMASEDGPRDGKSEKLGSKTIEGVSVEGTKTTFEIPAGQLGNEKPIQVVDEKWFSPELQVVVRSSHLDPVNGEHVFRLVNIKRSEPSAELFAVPAGYRVENQNDRRPKE